MKKSISILVLEDNSADAELVIRELRRAGYDPTWKRVDTEADYLAGLDPAPDLILADYSLPSFDGLRAVRLLHERRLDIPFILVSGSVGEDRAVEAIKAGANDYLLKDRIARLGSAVNHALHEKQLRDERNRADTALRESELHLRNLMAALPVAVYTCDAEGRITFYNEAAVALWGRTPEVGRELWCGSLRIFSPDGQPMRAEECPMAFTLRSGRAVRDQAIIVERPDGSRANVLPHPTPLRDSQGVLVGAVNVLVDITTAKRAAAELKAQLDELLRWQEVMLNREDRVQYLKDEVNALLATQKLPPRYAANPEARS